MQIGAFLKTYNLRTPANDPRNRGQRIPGWGFDPNWVNGSVQMASLVFDAAKPMHNVLFVQSYTPVVKNAL